MFRCYEVNVMFIKKMNELVGHCKRLRRDLRATGKTIVMVVTGHDDDGIIGLGPVFSMLCRIPDIVVIWVIICGHDDRPERRNDIEAVAKRLGIANRHVLILWFRDGFMDSSPAELRRAMWPLCTYLGPKIVFIHQSMDSNSEHKAVSDACVRLAGSNGTRLILGYEVPKPWPERFNSNCTVLIPKRDVTRAARLLDLFKSEIERNSKYVDPDWSWARAVDAAKRVGLSNRYGVAFEVIRCVPGMELFLAIAQTD